jgi:hypothetical protein
MASDTPAAAERHTALWKTILYAALAATALILGLYAFDHRDKPFSREAWVEGNPERADTGDTGARGAMLDDLLATHHLVGMSQRDIEALLGPPGNYTDSDPRQLVYPVTMSWDVIDPSSGSNLDLDLDSHQVVTSYRVETWRRR